MLDLAGKTTDQRRSLLNRLARAYQTRTDQARVCDEIELDTTRIDLSGAPLYAWAEIYAEAARQGKVPALEVVPTTDVKRCQVCDGVVYDDGARRPVLESRRDVDDAIAWLWGATMPERMAGRAIVWMVSDCCATADAIALLDTLMQLAPVEQSPSQQLVALTMTTHTLAAHLPSRSRFLSRARARLLELGKAEVVQQLSDLRNAEGL